jgi:MarR family transcriptional regulator, transcriptional regulator for hemolysin
MLRKVIYDMTRSPEDDVLFSLYDVARLLRVRFDQRANLVGMTRAQWVILIWLERRPGITQNELASLVEVEPITIARLVDRLEARHMVERRHDVRDRRVRRLHLTDDVKPLLRDIHAYRRELERSVMSGLSREMRKQFHDTLNILKFNLLEDKRENADEVHIGHT